MTFPRRPLLMLALGGIAFGSYGLWRIEQTRARVAHSIPPQPALSGALPVLRERIAAAEAAVRSRLHARDGLKELGRLYHANGYLAEASSIYRGLLHLDPDNPRWSYLLATILSGYGQLDEAMPLLERTLQLAPDYAPARLKLADALFKTNAIVAARAAFASVLDRDPSNSSALLGLARIEVSDKRWTEARERLRSILQRDEDFAAAWALLASIEEQQGNAEDAAFAHAGGQAAARFRQPPDPWLDELLNDCYDVYQLRVAGSAISGSEDSAPAIALLERALTLAPGDATTHRQLGKLLRDLGRPSDARRHLEQAVKLDPDAAEGWGYLIDLLNEIQDFTAADHAIAEGLARCPDASSLHLLRGRQLKREGQIPEAAAALEFVCRLRPEEVNGRIELAGIYLRLDRPLDAEAELHRALKAQPADPAALTTLTRYYIFRGNEPAARNWFEHVRRQTRTPPERVKALEEAFRERFASSPP